VKNFIELSANLQRVECRLDERTYAKGRRISDTRMAEVNLLPDAFHGKWNYTINPIAS
jgi:hypothetical protein